MGRGAAESAALAWYEVDPQSKKFLQVADEETALNCPSLAHHQGHRCTHAWPSVSFVFVRGMIIGWSGAVALGVDLQSANLIVFVFCK